MTAGVIAEILGTIGTLAGSGAFAVSRLTRIAIAAEQLAEDIKALATQQAATQTQVTDHERRLNRAKL